MGMTYRYFVSGVERKVEDMTKEEKRDRALVIINSIGGKLVSEDVVEKYMKNKQQVTA